MAFANLHQIDGSGVKGVISLQEMGADTAVSGSATNLDAGKLYVTLAYDSGSVPSGPMACFPTNGSPGILGMWSVDQNGIGTLSAMVESLDVSEIGAVSIRIFNIEPPRPLQACGRVHVNGRGY